jgi:signal transduction histidine kinase
MQAVDQGGSPAPRSLPEAVTRFLRHEVGDLLQSIYATAAILQRRLPAEWEMERRIVADLRGRAESCKNLLDTVHDFICPLTLNLEPVNLAQLADGLVSAAAAQYPQLQVQAEAVAAPVVMADPNRLTHVGKVLLAQACETARQQVGFRTAAGPGTGEAEWILSADGPGLPAEWQERLANPFVTSRPSPRGLGLALAHRLVLLHGGQLTAEPMPGGGARVRVLLPGVPPGEPRPAQ